MEKAEGINTGNWSRNRSRKKSRPEGKGGLEREIL